ncbi:hypothetical protein PLICRDRAFT_328520 [Plicaturopsis crispa FD-325 SS-3]|uniref:Uncharacterized protein n=1 Tax=Plicaturopsis crispa FD-325 SS-3 TaxID=944288 RepID=A0A0C9SRT2_PLICR|nr:hypothetical protein PLICRDRAFT_328520 [Plicaturopsis crispa FD-325 SS-3]
MASPIVTPLILDCLSVPHALASRYRLPYFSAVINLHLRPCLSWFLHIIHTFWVGSGPPAHCIYIPPIPTHHNPLFSLAFLSGIIYIVICFVWNISDFHW